MIYDGKLWKTSDIAGLCAGFLVKNFIISFLSWGEYSGGSLLGYLWTILYPKAIKLGPSNGGCKAAKIYRTQPTAQLSTLKSYGWCLINSGERYKGVPTLVLWSLVALEIIFETPRSPILISFLILRKILSVFMSLWMMLFLWR